MPETREVTAAKLDPTQASELALLVDLEAGWENLRKAPSRGHEGRCPLQDLHGKQKAYEAFRTKLVTYNQRYSPAHVPELLLNTPSRLGIWCRTMRALFLLIEPDPQGHSPLHLLEKAYRRADRLSVLMNKECVSRGEPPDTIRAAIQNLEALGQWCDDLVNAAAALPASKFSPV